MTPPVLSSCQDLATRNLRLAYSLARPFRRRYPHLAEDLDAQAALGLCAAAEQFDPNRGVPFAAYARRCILGSLLDLVRHEARHAGPALDPVMLGRLEASVEIGPLEMAEFLAEAQVQAAAAPLAAPVKPKPKRRRRRRRRRARTGAEGRRGDRDPARGQRAGAAPAAGAVGLPAITSEPVV